MSQQEEGSFRRVGLPWVQREGQVSERFWNKEGGRHARIVLELLSDGSLGNEPYLDYDSSLDTSILTH